MSETTFLIWFLFMAAGESNFRRVIRESGDEWKWYSGFFGCVAGTIGYLVALGIFQLWELAGIAK